MTIRDVLLAALLDRFGDQALRVDAPPGAERTGLGHPIAWFPAKHPEVGEASVWVTEIHQSSFGTVLTAAVAIGVSH
jgi:hypothetical protein